MKPKASSPNMGLSSLALSAHLLSLAEVSMPSGRCATYIKVPTK